MASKATAAPPAAAAARPAVPVPAMAAPKPGAVPAPAATARTATHVAGQTPAARPATTAPAAAPAAAAPQLQYPSESTMMYAMKLSLKQDKPIVMSFWFDSLDKSVYFKHSQVGDTKETILYKSEDEYTSNVIGRHTRTPEHIAETENSLYIIAPGVVSR